MPLPDKLKRLIIKNSSEWIEKVPAFLGNNAGVVLSGTQGIHWARFVNGQEVLVYNRVAPAVFDTKVMLGKSKSQPTFWQVLGVRETYLTPSSNFVGYHGEQHTFPAGDTVWIQRQQMLPLSVLVYNSNSFVVQVFGAIVRTRSGVAIVATQTLSLASYVPAEKAVYVSIETDDDGAISVQTGTPFELPIAADLSNVPVPTAGKYMLAFVLLYYGMPYLLDSDIRVMFPLEHNPSNITDALTGYVDLTTDQTVAGIKTFSSFPITPSSAPTTNYQVANKKYVDDGLAGAGAVTSVNGDTGVVVIDELQTALALTGIIDVTLSADTNDWNPTGLSTASVIRLISSEDCTITGIAGGTPGRVLMIENSSPVYKFFFPYNDTNSTPGYRFFIPSPGLYLYPLYAVIFIYDSTSARWRMVQCLSKEEAALYFVGLTGNQTIAGTKTFSSDVLVPDEAYDATAWDASLEVPTKNALRDKIETLLTSANIEDAINDGTTTKAPSENAVFDALALKIPTSYLDTDGTLAANSDSKIATQKAVKTYVDTVAQGLTVKPPAIVATTTTLPSYTYLSSVITAVATGVLTIDGHAVALNEYILVKDETGGNAPYNGLYKCTTAGAIGVAYVLTRAIEMNVGSEFIGALVVVETGTVNAGALWLCSNTTAPTVGVTNIAFVELNRLGDIVAGAALTSTGNQLDVAVDNSTIEVSSDALRLKDAGTTLAKLANIADATILGNNTGGAAAPVALTASQIRTLLALVIGTNVQAYDADLTTWAGLTPSANAQSLVTAADYAAMRSLLGLVIGTDVQAYDAELAALAGLTSAADKFPYFTGGGTASLLTIVSAIRTLLASADVATFRTNAGLAIGTNVQAYDADLTTWAGLTPSANAQSLVTAADYAAMRTLLGLVIGTNVQAYDADLTTWAGLTPSANAQSLVTAADYAAMRTLLDTTARDGWIPITATGISGTLDSPSFEISFNADMTALIGLGDRIKITQSTTKYFIVTKVGAFAAGATIITCYGGTDYTLVATATTAITNPFVSHDKTPFGFPTSPTKWTVSATDTSSRSQATPTSGTWYNLGSLSISMPIGAWNVSYKVMPQATSNAAQTFTNAFATLSTANNSESDADMTTAVGIGGASGTLIIQVATYAQKTITVTAKTTHYINAKTTQTTVATLFFRNDLVGMIINLVCSYL